MARPKRKTTKVTRRRMRASASASAAPVIDIKSPTDVKKALEIMQKFPLTVILVFANWCPHCHTYMKEWNSYKRLPNRTSPMVSVESNNSAELVKFLRDSNGEEVTVNAFPSVFVSKPASNSTNMVEPISTSDRSSMVTLLNKGSAAVSNEPGSVSEDPMSVEEAMTSSSANMSAEDSASANASNNYLNGSMNSAESNAESSSLRNASDFTESIRTNTATSAGVTPFRKAKGLSNSVIAAVKKATKRRRNVASASAASNSILPAINTNRFAKPPQRKEQPYNLTMGGGGPSGLIKLQGGGLSPNGSLYAALRQYAAAGTQTRKNYN